jgi:S1-C subfamily serine protease
MAPRAPSLVPRVATTALVAASLAFGCDRADSSGGQPTAKAEPGPAEEPAKAADEKPPVVDEKLVVNTKTEPTVQTPVVDPLPPVQTPKVDAPPADARTADETNSIDVFEAAAPATVFVTQTAVITDMAMRSVEVPAGAGTGFIWDTDGHIVTNCHVALVDCPRGIKAPKLSVTLYDKKVYDAELVGSDSFKDIAVLKITPPEGLVPIRRPSKDYKLTVGQKTIAIGNPFGLDHTLTTGVVSALGREVNGIGDVKIRDMVQTDAAINPGNSGGPLLDSQGQLIGMNTMIFSRSGSSAGIGFAVPHGAIGQVVPQIIKTGKPMRVGLGITKEDDSASIKLGVEGVIVRSVSRESPAYAGGLRGLERVGADLQFDVIVGIGTKRVKTYDDLYAELESKTAGDKVTLQVKRMPEGKVFNVETELVEL